MRPPRERRLALLCVPPPPPKPGHRGHWGSTDLSSSGRDAQFELQPIGQSVSCVAADLVREGESSLVVPARFLRSQRGSRCFHRSLKGYPSEVVASRGEVDREPSACLQPVRPGLVRRGGKRQCHPAVQMCDARRLLVGEHDLAEEVVNEPESAILAGDDSRLLCLVEELVGLFAAGRRSNHGFVGAVARDGDQGQDLPAGTAHLVQSASNHRADPGGDGARLGEIQPAVGGGEGEAGRLSNEERVPAAATGHPVGQVVRRARTRDLGDEGNHRVMVEPAERYADRPGGERLERSSPRCPGMRPPAAAVRPR